MRWVLILGAGISYKWKVGEPRVVIFGCGYFLQIESSGKGEGVFHVLEFFTNRM